jgi:hypothetical protein
MIFATKTGNKGKLDSHCWYFDAFAYMLQPDYCILFDAGEQHRQRSAHLQHAAQPTMSPLPRRLVQPGSISALLRRALTVDVLLQGRARCRLPSSTSAVTLRASPGSAR